MTAKKRGRPKKVQLEPITLREFKAWLEGVEELQPDDWCPDLEQWKKIRSKINCISPETIHTNIPQQPVQPQATTNYPPQPNDAPRTPPPRQQQPPMRPRQVQPQQPSALEQPAQDVQMTEAAKAAMSGKLPAPGMDMSADGKIKTPNVDSSDGTYTSSFT